MFYASTLRTGAISGYGSTCAAGYNTTSGEYNKTKGRYHGVNVDKYISIHHPLRGFGSFGPLHCLSMFVVTYFVQTERTYHTSSGETGILVTRPQTTDGGTAKAEHSSPEQLDRLVDVPRAGNERDEAMEKRFFI